MRTVACIAAGLLASYAALVLALNNLGTVSGAACSSEFTLPAIACRIGGLGITLLLVPLSGALVFLATRKVLKR